MPSTRSFSRARRSGQRGYALISAIVLAVLYFGLIELLLLDSARELAEARRFRARIIAETLAENAAERAAVQIVTTDRNDIDVQDWQGSMLGRMRKNAMSGQFQIEGEGVSSGITEAKARVIVYGRVVGSTVKIQYTQHTY